MSSRVLLGDCMDFMREMKDGEFDLSIVDPPYGINATKMSMGTNRTRKEYGQYPGESVASRIRKGRLNQGAGKLKGRALNNMNCDWDFLPPEKEYFEELFRISKNQIIWGGNYFDLPPTRCIICWDKKQPWDNFSQWEMAWTSFNKPAKMYRISNKGGDNKERKIHPTQKPVKLYDCLYRDFAEKGIRVIDTHLGSGTNRISAYKAEVDFLGIEYDEMYFRDSIACFDEFTKQRRLSFS